VRAWLNVVLTADSGIFGWIQDSETQKMQLASVVAFLLFPLEEA